MFVRTLSTVAVAVAFAGPALAGQRIVTPRLDLPAAGRLNCTVANASDSKNIEATIAIYDGAGNVVSPGEPIDLAPNTTALSGAGTLGADHCVVEVTKGSKRNARVSLYTTDALGNTVAAVNGQ